MGAGVEAWMAEIGPADAWEGSPYDEVALELKKAHDFGVEELWDGLPGAESFRDFHDRVTNGLRDALGRFGVAPSAEHPGLWNGDADVTLVLVAHGGTNAVVTGHLLGVEPTPWEWDRFDSAHTSVVTLVTRPVAQRSAFGLMGFGDVTHLDADMITR
jgi:probable phosphoglycerate mutase